MTVSQDRAGRYFISCLCKVESKALPITPKLPILGLLDQLHKLTRQIVNEHQVIAAESMQVKNMVKYLHLSKDTSDAAWGELVRQLDYKSAWAGRQFVQIDHWYPSSKRCHGCGHVMASLPLDVRTWDCPSCGTQGIDRDLNIL